MLTVTTHGLSAAWIAETAQVKRLIAAFACRLVGRGAVIAGATLATVTVNGAAPESPSLSVTVTVTV